MNIILGQNESPEPVNVDSYVTIGTIWDDINAYCETKTSPEQCRALLGWRPLYFPPIYTEKPKIPIWALLLIGYVAGKHNII